MQEGGGQLKITIETLVKAELNTAWAAWRAGFDFEGTYTRIVPQKIIEYRLGDGRDVKVEFTEGAHGVPVRETFEAESQIDRGHQRQGWQAILDNFARHVESKDIAGTAGN
jgi:uncharacterized protein YndB with AHSA1/START domain